MRTGGGVFDIELTTTTSPSSSARCTLDAALASPACAGQTIPTRLTAKLTKAKTVQVIFDTKVTGDKTGSLKGTVTHDITIPANALPDASKMFVKVYPGVMSQVLEGVDGLIRLPGG